MAISLEFKTAGDFSQIGLTKFLAEHSHKLVDTNVDKEFDCEINLDNLGIMIFFVDKVQFLGGDGGGDLLFDNQRNRK